MSDEHPEPEVKVVDRRWWARQGATADAAGGSGDAEWRPGKPSYVEELERQLAEKDRQLQETVAKYREASREFDEARARLRKDVARDVERGRRAMLAEMLEILDNLDRALEAARRQDAAAPLVQGVEMVRRLFLAKLESFGVRPIEALDLPFDPSRHEAVSVVPVFDPSRDGHVCGVLTAGYTIDDDVLRPAVVAVGQLAQEAAPGATEHARQDGSKDQEPRTTASVTPDP
jgi:molecular chaperone GrpE